MQIISKHPQLWILLLALLMRLPLTLSVYSEVLSNGSVYQSQMSTNSDQNEYLRLGENIITIGQYSSESEAPYEPNLKRVPGYPVVLSLLYFLAGMQHAPLLILGLNVLLSVLSVYLIMRIVEVLFDTKTALLAGLIYAVAPITIMLVTQALTETLFTTLLLGLVFCSISTELQNFRDVIVQALILAILTAAATYVRAIALYVLPMLILAVILRNGWSKFIIPYSLLTGAVFGMLLVPWYAHNYQQFGEWTFSSVSSGNLLTYNAASVYSTREDIGLRASKDQMIEFLNVYLEENPPPVFNNATFNQARRAVAMEILLDNLPLTVFVHVRDSFQSLRPGYSLMNLVLDEDRQAFGNNVNTGSLPNPSELSLLQLGVFGYMTLYYGLLYLLTFVGIVIVFSKRRLDLILLLLALPYWFVFIPSIAGNSRFRVPIEGFMAVLAALSLLMLLGVFNRMRHTPSEA